MTLSLNGVTANSVKLAIPWRGVWCADVDLSAEDATVAQALASIAAPALLQLNDVIFTGVIDPAGSGTFQSKTSIRVVGGRNGWSKTVPARHFYGSGGSLLSSMVFSATGAEVSEVATDTSPVALGTHFGRMKGPASSVFDGRDWFVDPITTTTFVSAWPSLPFDPDGVIADFSPEDNRATLTSLAPILPGTVLSDSRFNGVSYTIREVEQTFDSHGATALAWCSASSASPLADELGGIVRALADITHARMYKYRFVAPLGGDMSLQAVTAGAPDLNPISQWSGLSGSLDALQPGSELVIGFVGKEPFVVSFSPLGTPTTMALRASTSITLTAPALAVSGVATFGLPGTAVALAKAAPVDALVAALKVFATGLNGASLAGNAAALLTALNGIPSAATLMKGQ